MKTPTPSLRRALCLLLLLSALIGVAADPNAPPISAYFGPRAADDETSIYHNLLRFLDGCDTRIHGSLHELDMAAVAQKLADRAAAGVQVQLVLEQRYWDNPKNLAARQILERGGVEVTLDTKKSGLMHNKFFVGDAEWVWTGSTNLTETGLFYNPNNAVWLNDKRLNANFESEFQEQRAGGFGKRGSGAPNTPFKTVQLDADTRVVTMFSPEDEPVPDLVAAIDRATKRIDVMSFVFSSEEIAEALIRAHKRGVSVHVLLDNLFSSTAATARWRYVPAHTLTDAGITVRYDDEASKLHHKVMVIDDSVITGSFNFSANAANNNDENVLIIDDAPTAAAYRAEFQRLWAWYTTELTRATATTTLYDEEGDTDVE